VNLFGIRQGNVFKKVETLVVVTKDLTQNGLMAVIASIFENVFDVFQSLNY